MGKDTTKSSVTNSFLQETEQNSDVDDEIRLQIEKRYTRSKTNKRYIFPRVQTKSKAKFKGSHFKKSSSKTKVDTKSFINKSNDLKTINSRIFSTRNLNHKTSVRHKKTKSEVVSYVKFLKSPYHSNIQSTNKVPKASLGVPAKVFSKIKSPTSKLYSTNSQSFY